MRHLLVNIGEYNAGYNLSNRSLEILFVWVSMAVTPVAVTAMEKEGTEKSQEWSCHGLLWPD